MKITFIGVPGEEHEQLTMYGYTFPLGKAVEVDRPEVVRRLKDHPHFKVHGAEAESADPLKVGAGAVHAAQATQALAASAVSMGAAGLLDQQAAAGVREPDKPIDEQAQRDADAINAPALPVEGEEGEREKLEAYAEARGIKTDRRWNLERLRSTVMNANAAAARTGE